MGVYGLRWPSIGLCSSGGLVGSEYSTEDCGGVVSEGISAGATHSVRCLLIVVFGVVEELLEWCI